MDKELAKIFQEVKEQNELLSTLGSLLWVLMVLILLVFAYMIYREYEQYRKHSKSNMMREYYGLNLANYIILFGVILILFAAMNYVGIGL